MIDQSTGFSLPSNPAELRKIRNIFFEMSGLKQTIKDRQQDYKDFVETLSTEYDIPKKLIPKVAKIFAEHNYEDYIAEVDGVQQICEGLGLGSEDGASDTDSEDDEA